VTCFNQQDTIQDALFSALNQSYSPLEIVISDDCSTDDSFERISNVVKSYQGPANITVNRNEVNLGIAGNCNRGVELSTGEIIVFCGGDDISRHDRAEKIADVWVREGSGPMLIHSDFTQIDSNGEVLQEHCVAKDLPAQDTALMIAKHYLNVGAQAWSRSLFDIFGPLSTSALVEDVPITFRAALIGKIIHLREPVLYYRTGGISHKRNDKIDRLKRARWKTAAYKCYIDDLQKVDSQNKNIIESVCHERLQKAILQEVGHDLRVNKKGLFHAIKLASKYKSSRPLIAQLKSKLQTN